jgi:hypothetical protein
MQGTLRNRVPGEEKHISLLAATFTSPNGRTHEMFHEVNIVSSPSKHCKSKMAQTMSSGKNRLAQAVRKRCKYNAGDKPAATPKGAKKLRAKYENGGIVAVIRSRKINFALEEKDRVVREAVKRSKISRSTKKRSSEAIKRSNLKSNMKRSSEAIKRSNEKRRKAPRMHETSQRENAKRTLANSRRDPVKRRLENSNRDLAKRALENSNRDLAKRALESSKRTNAQKQQMNSKRTDVQKQQMNLLRYYKQDDSGNVVGQTEEIKNKRLAYATSLPGQDCKKYQDNFIHYSLHEKLLAHRQHREQVDIWRKYQYCGVVKHGSRVSSEAFLKLTHKDLNFTSPSHCEVLRWVTLAMNLVSKMVQNLVRL